MALSRLFLPVFSSRWGRKIQDPKCRISFSRGYSCKQQRFSAWNKQDLGHDPAYTWEDNPTLSERGKKGVCVCMKAPHAEVF